MWERRKNFMWLNKMYVWENQGLFYIYSPQNELRAIIALPNNGQHLYNTKVLDGITRILAKVWGICQPAVK